MRSLRNRKSAYRRVSKLLVLVIAIVVIYIALSGFPRKRRHRPEPTVEPMVPCAHCGVNLPRGEALDESGRFYCSEEHRRLGAR